MIKKLTFDVIVPTKNRQQDLVKLLKSIKIQKICPQNVIIVDQSDTALSAKQYTDLLAGSKSSIKTIYIHNNDISGLVEAKSVGINIASSEFVFFLDDDLILKPNYFQNILLAFQKHKELQGCAGFIDNAKSNKYWLLIFGIFHKGLFHDPRPSIFNSVYSNDQIILTPKIPQGVSAWRMSIFDVISFDPSLNFHMVEDLHFSICVEKLYPNSQAIITNACVSHFHAKSGRDDFQQRFARKLYEFSDLWRANKNLKPTLDYVLLLTGFLCEAIYYAVRLRNLRTLWSFLKFISLSIAFQGRGRR